MLNCWDAQYLIPLFNTLRKDSIFSYKKPFGDEVNPAISHKIFSELWPWPGSSVGQSIIPHAEVAVSSSGQGT